MTPEERRRLEAIHKATKGLTDVCTIFVEAVREASEAIKVLNKQLVALEQRVINLENRTSGYIE